MSKINAETIPTDSMIQCKTFFAFIDFLLFIRNVLSFISDKSAVFDIVNKHCN